MYTRTYIDTNLHLDICCFRYMCATMWVLVCNWTVRYILTVKGRVSCKLLRVLCCRVLVWANGMDVFIIYLSIWASLRMLFIFCLCWTMTGNYVDMLKMRWNCRNYYLLLCYQFYSTTGFLLQLVYL